nr:uncharacterized protein LOC109146573 isoform X1 [Ipomoea batatas]GMC98747.1 uncharacterized protein LOC109146573 isoform X1 [Ipomoea batatas]GMD20424.1 uncharacterized protein LOC109146573 isoform X1 [Ipomoea batatas]GME20503.1 uncharacterized protein LOC109146573 isoform X1 [Ipomoea batatas]
MASCISTSSTSSNLSVVLQSSSYSARFKPSFPISVPVFSSSNHRALRLCCYAAAKQQTGPVKKRTNSKTKKNKRSSSSTSLEAEVIDEDVELEFYERGAASSERYHPLPLPKPPAGFVLDEQGRVLMVSNKRIVTIVDSSNNLPLECIIRRVFRSTQGVECLLLCPLDMPILVLKSANFEGWSAVSDDEVETILPTAAYALAKIHMHLVHSGFCYTARGGFCYTEGDIFDLCTDDGGSMEGVPTEGVEITCFHLDGSHYMIYTPSDPLLFVAVKDKDGVFQIAEDELLEDPAIVSAIDEETEFNALVEEEAALFESLLGER